MVVVGGIEIQSGRESPQFTSTQPAFAWTAGTGSGGGCLQGLGADRYDDPVSTYAYFLPFIEGAPRMDMGHDLAMALRAAYWAMHRDSDTAFEPLGVTANQFVLMSLLADHEALTQRELVDRASSDPNTIRAMLLVLQRNGLVNRTAHPSDGRAWLVSLTPKGRRSYQRMKVASTAIRSKLQAAVQPFEPEALVEALLRIAKTFGADAPGTAKRSRRSKRDHCASAVT